MSVYLLLYCFTATIMHIATVVIIIDVSTLRTPEVEWGMSPCYVGRDHHYAAYLVVESLRRSWGAGAQGFHLRVPDLQVGWTSMQVVRGVDPGVSGRVTCPAVVIVIIIITLLQKVMVPHDHCLVFIWSIDMMTLLILVVFFSE